jgi:hypothetical protein
MRLLPLLSCSGRAGNVNPDLPISFETLSGTLTARKDGEWITLDFPAEPVTATGPVTGLSEALGTEPPFHRAEPARYPF